MKRHWLTATIGAAMLLAASSAAAQTIDGTKHDLAGNATFGDGTNDDGRVCIYCHTPHNANSLASNAPLWNRKVTASGYSMYDSATLDGEAQTSPQGVSLACLSCHDGQIAVDNLFGDAWGNSASTKKIPTSSDAYFGLNLSFDHPISITLDTSADGDLKTQTTLPLYGTNDNQVECGSCHDPHDNQVTPFLRLANTDSALCYTCHNK